MSVYAVYTRHKVGCHVIIFQQLVLKGRLCIFNVLPCPQQP